MSLRTRLIRLAYDNPEFRDQILPLLREGQGDAWSKLPKGWTEDSLKKFWDTLTGDVKHKVTKCMKEMEGKVDDTGAFCGSLARRLKEGTISEQVLRIAVNIPKKVEEYAKGIKEGNPDYDDAQVYATAWSIFCKYHPDPKHCTRPPGEYLTGRKASRTAATLLRVMLPNGRAFGYAPDTTAGALWLGYLAGQQYQDVILNKMKVRGRHEDDFFQGAWAGRPSGRPPIGTRYLSRRGKWLEWSRQGWVPWGEEPEIGRSRGIQVWRRAPARVASRWLQDNK